MNKQKFNSQLTLEETAEDLGKKAMAKGLIPSFVIHFYTDSWVFYIPKERSEPLTPEEAYFYFQKLLES
jgi:hypothetical protein